MKTIAEQVRQFLALSGVTGYRLSKEAGLHRAYVWKLCNGVQKDTFFARADALHKAMRRIDPAAAEKAMSE